MEAKENQIVNINIITNQCLANLTPWVTYLHVIREGIGPHTVRLMAPLMIHIMIDHTMMGDEDH